MNLKLEIKCFKFYKGLIAWNTTKEANTVVQEYNDIYLNEEIDHIFTFQRGRRKLNYESSENKGTQS